MPYASHKSPRICSWVPHPQKLEGAGFQTCLARRTDTFPAPNVEIPDLVRRTNRKES